MPTQVLWSLSDISANLGLARATVHNWSKRWLDFPEPDYTDQNGYMSLYTEETKEKIINIYQEREGRRLIAQQRKVELEQAKLDRMRQGR